MGFPVERRYLSHLDLFTLATGGTLKPLPDEKQIAPLAIIFPNGQQQIPAQPLFLFERTFQQRSYFSSPPQFAPAFHIARAVHGVRAAITQPTASTSSQNNQTAPMDFAYTDRPKKPSTQPQPTASQAAPATRSYTHLQLPPAQPAVPPKLAAPEEQVEGQPAKQIPVAQPATPPKPALEEQVVNQVVAEQVEGQPTGQAAGEVEREVEREPGEPIEKQAPAVEEPNAEEREAAQERLVNLLVGIIKKNKMVPSYILKAKKCNFENLTPIQKAALKKVKDEVHFLDLSHVELTCDSIANIHTHFPHLRTLIAVDSQLTDEVVDYFSEFSELTRVNIEKNPLLTDQALASLSEITTLEELCLSDDYSDEGIAHLQNLKELLSLRLKDCIHVTNAFSATVKKLTTLKELHLVRCPRILDECVTKLFTENLLKKLTLVECPQVSDEIIAVFAECEGLEFSSEEVPLEWGPKNEPAPPSAPPAEEA